VDEFFVALLKTEIYIIYSIICTIRGLYQQLVLVLSVLDMMGTCCVKKAVVWVTELIDAVIPACCPSLRMWMWTISWSRST